jgi:hypothetical protein
MAARWRFIFVNELSKINGTSSTILFSSDCFSSGLFTWGIERFLELEYSDNIE